MCDFFFFFFFFFWMDGKRNYERIEPLAFDGSVMQPITQGGGVLSNLKRGGLKGLWGLEMGEDFETAVSKERDAIEEHNMGGQRI